MTAEVNVQVVILWAHEIRMAAQALDLLFTKEEISDEENARRIRHALKELRVLEHGGCQA